MKLTPTIFASLLVLGTATAALSHGDGAPSPVETTGLAPLGEDPQSTNPYRGQKLAVEIGQTGYDRNCARCHGIEAKSGGMSPDLREVPTDESGDIWFLARVQGGASKDGRVRMPPFRDILSQEAIWAIRTYVESRPKD